MSKLPLGIEVPLSLGLRVFDPRRRCLLIYPSIGGWCAISSDEKIYFPRDKINGVYRLEGNGRIPEVRDKYTNEEVYVEKGDVVFDIGSFVGTFIMSIDDIASDIYAFEVDPENRKYLEINTKDIDGVKIQNSGIWREDGQLSLNIGKDPTDNSFLQPDDGLKKKMEVDVTRIDTFCQENNIDKIDFLKLDAEGAEPEILESIGDMEIEKISVDCSPERNGEKTIDHVTAILEDDYNIYVKQQEGLDVVMGVKK